MQQGRRGRGQGGWSDGHVGDSMLRKMRVRKMQNIRDTCLSSAPAQHWPTTHPCDIRLFLSRFMRNTLTRHSQYVWFKKVFTHAFHLGKCLSVCVRVCVWERARLQRSNIKWSSATVRQRNRDKMYGVAYECHLQVQIFTFMAAAESGLQAGKYAAWIFIYIYIYTPCCMNGACTTGKWAAITWELYFKP